MPRTHALVGLVLLPALCGTGWAKNPFTGEWTGVIKYNNSAEQAAMECTILDHGDIRGTASTAKYKAVVVGRVEWDGAMSLLIAPGGVKTHADAFEGRAVLTRRGRMVANLKNAVGQEVVIELHRQIRIPDADPLDPRKFPAPDPAN